MNVELASTPCFRCGVCCSKYQIRASFIEARRIADELGITWEEWLEKYADRNCPRNDSFLLRRINGVCIFLQRTEGCNVASCLIQSFKPSACIDWNSSLYKRDCREGLEKYWGITVDSHGQLRGPPENLGRFKSFLDSQNTIVQPAEPL